MVGRTGVRTRDRPLPPVVRRLEGDIARVGGDRLKGEAGQPPLCDTLGVCIVELHLFYASCA